MSRIKNRDGFTLVEILVATLIMALGFLSLAEMETLSLRQKQRAESGTIATNVIQFISERDMAEVRRLYLLNSTAYVDVQAGRITIPPNPAYCNGSTTSACSVCPCDPLQALTPNPTDGTTESTCAIIDIQNFDPQKLNFRGSKTQCQTDAKNNTNADLFIVKSATTAVNSAVTPNIVTVSITYAVKTPTQFNKTGLGSVSLADSLASQAYQVTAHIDNYSNFIAGWNTVRIPHIP